MRKARVYVKAAVVLTITLPILFIGGGIRACREVLRIAKANARLMAAGKPPGVPQPDCWWCGAKGDKIMGRGSKEGSDE